MPNVIRALFRQGAVRLCQGAVAAEKGGKDGVAMEMRLTEWRVNMDMDKPNEELRAIAQRLDSDTDVKVRRGWWCVFIHSTANLHHPIPHPPPFAGVGRRGRG